MSHPVKPQAKPTTRANPTPAKTAAAKKAASAHILSAPKGPRTLTYRVIGKAVHTVIKARARPPS
jgi:hypothetical protein